MNLDFMFYDLAFLAVFFLAIGWFVIRHRKKLGREGPIFLYRTEIGLKIIDKISAKYGGLLHKMRYLVISVGYILSAATIYLLLQLVGLFSKPEYVQMIKIPPLMPFIPYLPEMFKITWLPPLYFTYWIVITAVIAFVHEGFHGIYARLYNVKIKSTGFGFLGPILTFFVEPDEKDMQKKKLEPQMTILSAGVFGNVLATIVFLAIMIAFFSIFYAPAGALFNTYTYTTIPVSMIAGMSAGTNQIALDGVNLTEVMLDNKSYFIWNEHLNSAAEYTEGYINIYQNQPAIKAGLKGAISKIGGAPISSQEDIRAELDKHAPGDTITVQTKSKTEVSEYNLVLGEDYNTPGRTVIGIGVVQAEATGVRGFLYKMTNAFRNPAIYYEPLVGSSFVEFIYYLLWWIVFVNLGVALFNIIPVAIADGGKFWYLTVLGITKSEKIAKRFFKISTAAILALFALLMVLWAIGMF